VPCLAPERLRDALGSCRFVTSTRASDSAATPLPERSWLLPPTLRSFSLNHPYGCEDSTYLLQTPDTAANSGRSHRYPRSIIMPNNTYYLFAFSKRIVVTLCYLTIMEWLGSNLPTFKQWHAISTIALSMNLIISMTRGVRQTDNRRAPARQRHISPPFSNNADGATYSLSSIDVKHGGLAVNHLRRATPVTIAISSRTFSLFALWRIAMRAGDAQ